MNPAKIHFWQLIAVFSIVAIIAISQSWAGSGGKPAGMMTQMMGGAMGSMMKMMHASNITLNDLLVWQTKEKGVSQSKAKEFSPYLYQLHHWTTKTIFFLTPFILAGVAIIVASWLWGD